MKKIFLTALFVLLPLVAAMAEKPQKAESMVTKAIDLEGFTGIVANDMFNIDVKKGDYFDVTVEVAEDLANRLSVKVKDNKIIFAVDKDFFKFRIITSRDLFVHIVMPELTSLKLKGSASFTGSGSFVTDGDFALEVEGSSTIEGLDITARKVDAEIKGGSTVKMKASASNYAIEESGASAVSINGKLKELNANVWGASSLVLTGSADQATVEAAGMSKVDAVGMKMGNCKSKISGLSSLTQF